MIEKPLNESIEDYVTGRINPEEKIHLEEMAANDPEVFEQLNAAKSAYDFLERSYYRDVKKKLQEYDLSSRKNTDAVSGKMMRVAIFSISLIAILWMISYWYYQPVNMAKRFYHPFTEQLQQRHRLDPIVQLKMTANKSFLEKEFTEAGTTLQFILAQSDNDGRMHAQWNYLMCQLAIHGPSPDWRFKLDAIIDQSDEPIKRKAIKLKRQVNSWAYRITFFQFTHELSSLKPRLI